MQDGNRPDGLTANSVAARRALDLGRHSGAHASGLLCERDGFFSALSCKIASVPGDSREPSFLFQRISITIQRFNSILLHNSFSSDEE